MRLHLYVADQAAGLTLSVVIAKPLLVLTSLHDGQCDWTFGLILRCVDLHVLSACEDMTPRFYGSRHSLTWRGADS